MGPPLTHAARALPPGIRLTPTGFRVFVRVRGRLYSKRFPSGTSPTTMKQWRETQRVRVRLAIVEDPGATTFREDAADYLRAVATMPTIAWRTVDIDRWVHALGGDRPRASITSLEVRQQLERWRQDYAASTCNHRRTALMHLWTVLDGKSAPNPVKDVPRHDVPESGPRGRAPAVIQAILDAMPASQTKARLTLMAWTGWPQQQLAQLEPAHIRWRVAVYVTARKKGGGVRGAWLPLLPQAWRALREFKRLGCWGTFSRDSMRASFGRAAGKVAADPTRPRWIREAVEGMRPYDLRHSYGTLVAAITKDDTAVQELMRHADPRQSLLYTRGAVDPRIAAAVQDVARQLPRLLKRRKA